MHSKLFRLCSVIMALVMLFNMLPTTAFAVDLSTTTTDNAVEPSNEEIQILGEDESLRSATQKHFRMSDGSFMAVDYGVPVHYLTESGAWQEINNVPAMSAKANAYMAQNGDAITAYAANLSTGHVLTISYGDAAVSMGLLDTAQAIALTSNNISANSQAQLVTDGITFDRTATAQVDEIDGAARYSTGTMDEGWSTEDLIPAGLRSTTVYEDVFPGVDLQYTAFSHHIKEQIIVKEPQTSYRYDFMLSLEGLSAELNEDGSVTLADEDSEGVYTIPAPYMEDSAGAVSTDVSFTLTEVSGGIVLSVTADKDWINSEERVLPVRIDPTIELNTGTTNEDIFAAFAMEAAPDSPTMDWQPLYVGNMPYEPESLAGIYRLYIHFNNLPSIPAGSIVTHAALEMYLFDFPGYALNEVPLAAYDVTSELPSAYSDHRTWFKAITWRNQPQYDTSNAYDYVTCTSTLGYRAWDLTDAAKSWYFEGSDPTVAIITEDESMLTLNQYRSVGFYAYGYDYPPILTVTYRSDVGLEDYYSYTSVSAGRTGTGYINNYTGNLVWVRNDMGFGGNRMPVSINHVYNANGAANNEFGLGHGWRTNFNQRVKPVTLNGTAYYIWEDADGTAHYFFNDSGTYRDEDGLDLTMTISNGYIITDKYGNKSYFDTGGRLYKQENNQATKSSINITYTDSSNSYISTITDGAGRVYSFDYTGELLTKISYKGSGSSELYHTTYSYSSANLTTVTDKDGKSSSYAYGGNHLLTSAVDLGTYTLEFSYQATATGNNSRVVSVSESDGGVDGGALTIEYAHNQTTFEDINGNVQIMQFNNWGNMVSVQDGEGRAQFARYAKDENSGGKSNQLNLSSKLQNTVGNVLYDSSFENGTNWTSNNTAVSCAVTTETAYLGSKSLKMTRGTAGSEAGVYGVGFQVVAGETYTFSAYVKTGSGSAYLVWWDSSTVTYSEALPANSGWTRLEVTYTASATKHITPHVLTPDGGTTYIDCVQVEKAPTASRYNLVQNGDFRYGTSNWLLTNVTADNTTTTTPAAYELDGTAAYIDGDPNEIRHFYQQIHTSGKAGDSYVLSGWAKGDSAPLRDNRDFSLVCIFHNTDGTYTERSVTFNPDTNSTEAWQYAAGAVVADKDFHTLYVDIRYDYNVNRVLFDGIQLYKEEFGTSYTYDSNGNVVSVKDLQKQTTTYEYTNNNLTKQTLPTGAELTYTYDNYHNVLTAKSATGVNYNFAYDTYGNNTSVSIVSGSVKLTSSASYTTDGNRLATTTDAAGMVTTYSYNADTNVLEWIQYPEDTTTTKTEYTYDNMYRLSRTEADVSTGSTLFASYGYTNDLLTSITTGSTTYSFAYGNFALRSNIKIGSRTLASYAYTSRTNYLSSLDYGNGDSVDYTYDQQGRVTKQTYEDGDTVTYKYDNNGALASVTDSATGITTTYYYDFTDRLMKHVESGSGYSHSVGYEYDNINNLTALVETINGVKHTTAYTYDKDNRVSSITNGSVSETYTYDAFSRVDMKEAKNGSTTVLTDTFTYSNPSTTATAGQVRKLQSVASGYSITYTYTYDDNGNILSVSTSDGNSTTYTYDSANQLTRENNQAAGKTWVWTYDDAGNITSRKEYDYTTGSLGSVLSTVNYTYGDSSWGDLLTGWNGKTITSDTIGNMTSDGTWSYTWEHGRELTSMTSGGTTWNFTYNADGLRTKRTNGSTTYSYVYSGSSLSQMTVGGNTLYFAYDASGTPLSVTYNGTNYYYATNLQGDVTAILNTSGTAVVQYTYDAWGKLLTTTGSMASDLGVHNPLRYRGYVYDTETQLYYLQSRYYNPTIGRFICSDIAAATGQGILGNNTFAYCGNNPVSRADDGGYFWDLVFDVASLIVSVVEVVQNPTDVGAWVGLALDIVDVAVPVVGGLGEMADAVNAARKATATADKIRDTTKTVEPATKSARSNAVRKAWKNEVAQVMSTGKGSRDWTADQIDELLSTGKVKGYVGHHMKSVKGYPELAGDPSNIQFLTRQEHLLAHGGNWRNITHGRYVP